MLTRPRGPGARNCHKALDSILTGFIRYFEARSTLASEDGDPILSHAMNGLAPLANRFLEGRILPSSRFDRSSEYVLEEGVS